MKRVVAWVLAFGLAFVAGAIAMLELIDRLFGGSGPKLRLCNSPRCFLAYGHRGAHRRRMWIDAEFSEPGGGFGL